MSFGMGHQIGIGKTPNMEHCPEGIVNLFRYVRFALGRSNVNAGSYLNELQVIDTEGVNRALGRHEHLTPDATATYLSQSYKPANAFDGIINSWTWMMDYKVGKRPYVLDLGDSYALSEVRLYPYYPGRRIFQDVKIELSNDQEDWLLIYDSEASADAAPYTGRQVSSSDGLRFEVDLAIAFWQGAS